MASNYTTNYELPIWAADDAFLRTEFNEANQKIDAALAGMATSAEVSQAEGELSGALSALTARVAALEALTTERVRLAEGSYTGSGEVGADHPNTLTFPFPPKIVFIGEAETHSVLISPCPQAAGQVYGRGLHGILRLTWAGNSVSWYADGYYNGSFSETGGSAPHQLNEEGTVYRYLALG